MQIESLLSREGRSELEVTRESHAAFAKLRETRGSKVQRAAEAGGKSLLSRGSSRFYFSRSGVLPKYYRMVVSVIDFITWHRDYVDLMMKRKAGAWKFSGAIGRYEIQVCWRKMNLFMSFLFTIEVDYIMKIRRVLNFLRFSGRGNSVTRS